MPAAWVLLNYMFAQNKVDLCTTSSQQFQVGVERRPLFLHQDAVQGRRARQPRRRLRAQGAGRLRRRAQRHRAVAEESNA